MSIKQAALVLSCLVLAACGMKGAPELEGTWVGQRAENVPEAQKAAADALARTIVIKFLGSDLAVRVGNDVRNGGYGVLQADEAKKNFTITTEADGAESHDFELVDSETLRWKLLPNATVVLQRRQ